MNTVTFSVKLVGKLIRTALLAAACYFAMSLSDSAHASYLVRVSEPAQKANQKTKLVCSSGHACGNVCISRRYVCHRPTKVVTKIRAKR